MKKEKKKLSKEQKKALRKFIIVTVVFFLANLVFFLTLWLLQKYDRVYFDQFLYQMKTSAIGAHGALAMSAGLRVGVFSIVLTVVDMILYLVLTGGLKAKLHNAKYIRYCSTKICRFFRKAVLPIALACLVFSTTLFVVKFDVAAYIDTSMTESDFIENNYVDPTTVELSFPAEKRNLIYIFLESMENTFGDTSAGGKIQDNYIPELTQLALDNISFSNSEGLGGAYKYVGTAWTAAAMVAQTSGVIVKVPLTADYGDDGAYMPGLVSIGDVLAEQGYKQTLLIGSNSGFAARDFYFTNHGNYEILDTVSLKEAGRLPENYSEWWGYEDQKLFEFAKEELTRLTQSDQPFNFTMLTADTHFPDGYVCSECEEQHEEQYANVLACSSKQVAEFIKWVQAQPFYENTTIVLSGDHLSMDPGFFKEIHEDYTRTIYNCIINSPVEPVTTANRSFGTFDMFPTTLAAMGVKIEGDRLGLGTNLFSDKQTLAEEHGYDQLEFELSKHSDFYFTKFFGVTYRFKS